MINKDIEQYLSSDKSELADKTRSFELTSSELLDTVSELLKTQNFQLKLITATDNRAEEGCFKVWYIFALPKENTSLIIYVRINETLEFPSLTPIAHDAWNYERKIRSFFGLIPVGHPDTRQLLLHGNWPTNIFPLRKDFDWQERPEFAAGDYKFQKVEGEGIYELPVGPIHAGIIEPGHFRFSLAGEEIMLLEPLLGYTHKGSEKLFEILPLSQTVKLSEKISGDSSFSHSWAYCMALEKLSDVRVSERAEYLRVIYAELERLANHLGDIGAIMLDTGFNFGGANGARLREVIMQINEELTGSRFLRGVNTVGGVTKDISEEVKISLIKKLKHLQKDFSEVLEIAYGSTSLFNRLRDTGTISYEVAKNHGVTGVVARCVGMETDARKDFAYSVYGQLFTNDIAIENTGDVLARFNVRVKEVESSLSLIFKALETMPKGAIKADVGQLKLKGNGMVTSLIEGWRGEIVYFVTTDSQGRISRVAPKDPSFMNWTVVGTAGLGNMVPDFPLINKSFNMSYTGFDL